LPLRDGLLDGLLDIEIAFFASHKPITYQLDSLEAPFQQLALPRNSHGLPQIHPEAMAIYMLA